MPHPGQSGATKRPQSASLRSDDFTAAAARPQSSDAAAVADAEAGPESGWHPMTLHATADLPPIGVLL